MSANPPTGANPPVLRAAVLFALTLLSAGGSRCPRTLNTLGWTALLLLAWNPGSITDVAFQLSFIAVLGLGVAHPRLWDDSGREARLRRELIEIELRLGAQRGRAARRWPAAALRRAGAFLAVSTTAFLATSPLILHYFHRVHPLARPHPDRPSIRQYDSLRQRRLVLARVA